MIVGLQFVDSCFYRVAGTRKFEVSREPMGEILTRDKIWLVPFGPTGTRTNTRDQHSKMPH